MRKISYILGFALLSVGFMACDKEPLDEEVVNDDYVQGEQILRFDLNGVTRVAKGDEISTSVNSNGRLVIDVNIKDEYNDFQDINLRIVASDTEKGNYGTYYANFSPEDSGYSSANLNYAGDEWVGWDYSTTHIDPTLPDDQPIGDLHRGSITITNVNENTQQIEGNFEFELVPPYDLDLEQGVPYPSVQFVTNGYFKYIIIE